VKNGDAEFIITGTWETKINKVEQKIQGYYCNRV